MGRSPQDIVFAIAAALLVGAVFWLQPDRSSVPAVRGFAPVEALAPRAPLALDALARIAARERDTQPDAARATASAAAQGEGAQVNVRVLGPDGRPAAGRRVRLEGPRKRPTVHVTDAAGMLRLEGLRPGAWSFATWPEGDGLALAGFVGSLEPRFEFRREVLAAGEERSIVLGGRDAVAARLHGQLSRAGAGVAGRLALRHGPTGEVLGAETDAQGRFELALELPGAWRLEARRTTAPGSAALVREFELAPGGDLRLRLELPTGSIEGTVVGADGAPAAALVELWPADASQHGPVARALARAPLARFEFHDVAPGEWVLCFGDEAFDALPAAAPRLRVAGPSEPLTLAAGEALERTLCRTPASARAGRVLDDAGRGVEGAQVLTWRAEAPGEPRTAALAGGAGRFRTLALAPGSLALLAIAGERVSAPLVLEHGLQDGSAPEVELHLAPGAFLELEGAARFELHWLRDGMGRDFARLARSDGNGLRCGPLPPGTWSVGLARGDGSTALFEIELEPGERHRLRP